MAAAAAAAPLRLPESPPDELIEEVLLRLPPDEPSCLLRASLVCKTWRRIILHRRFRRRLHELHGRPPVPGFLRNNDLMGVEDFVATTSSAFSLAVPGIGYYTALDCRHGRALLLRMGMVTGSRELLLWDPIIGDQEGVPVPDAVWMNSLQGDHPTAAIVCAAAGCDHLGCHGRRPFKLVMVYSDSSRYEDDDDEEEEEEEEDEDENEEEKWHTWACSYSSDTGMWDDASRVQDFAMHFRMHTTSLLVGGSLLYFMSDHGTIIEYDLAGGDAAIISSALEFKWNDSVALILTEDGGLGVAESPSDSHLNIWSRVVSDSTPALWVKSRVICLENLLPAAALWEDVRPMSFADRANVLFIRTSDGIFTVELQSERVKKVHADDEDDDPFSLVPIEGFYTPRVSQGEEA